MYTDVWFGSFFFSLTIIDICQHICRHGFILIREKEKYLMEANIKTNVTQTTMNGLCIFNWELERNEFSIFYCTLLVEFCCWFWNLSKNMTNSFFTSFDPGWILLFNICSHHWIYVCVCVVCAVCVYFFYERWNVYEVVWKKCMRKKNEKKKWGIGLVTFMLQAKTLLIEISLWNALKKNI